MRATVKRNLPGRPRQAAAVGGRDSANLAGAAVGRAVVPAGGASC